VKSRSRSLFPQSPILLNVGDHFFASKETSGRENSGAGSGGLFAEYGNFDDIITFSDTEGEAAASLKHLSKTPKGSYPVQGGSSTFPDTDWKWFEEELQRVNRTGPSITPSNPSPASGLYIPDWNVDKGDMVRDPDVARRMMSEFPTPAVVEYLRKMSAKEFSNLLCVNGVQFSFMISEAHRRWLEMHVKYNKLLRETEVVGKTEGSKSWVEKMVLKDGEISELRVKFREQCMANSELQMKIATMSKERAASDSSMKEQDRICKGRWKSCRKG
jgi:hypothetical protein